MVIRTRIRAILYPIIFYALAGVASFYFVDTAINGERGTRTKDEYRKQITALGTTLNGLKRERAAWDHRISLMRSEAIDQDLLDEEARLKLDFVDPHDLVVFTDRR